MDLKSIADYKYKIIKAWKVFIVFTSNDSKFTCRVVSNKAGRDSNCLAWPIGNWRSHVLWKTCARSFLFSKLVYHHRFDAPYVTGLLFASTLAPEKVLICLFILNVYEWGELSFTRATEALSPSKQWTRLSKPERLAEWTSEVWKCPSTGQHPRHV